MIEIRWHGRGGQGAVTSAEILAIAAIEEGKFAQGFPSFGSERRGAPVMAFNRIDKKPIRLRSLIYEPDIVVVLDGKLIWDIDVTKGLKPNGILIVSTGRSAEKLNEQLNFKGIIGTLDANRIAKEELGVPITNTTMLGALVKATGVINLNSLNGPIERRFGRITQNNLEAIRRAYNEVEIAKFSS